MVLGFVVLVGACSGEDVADESPRVEQASSPLMPTKPITASFELTYPAGTDVDRVAVGAGARLDLGPAVRILGGDESAFAVTNVGASFGDFTTLGPNVKVGAVRSVPSIVAGPGIDAHSLTSSGTIHVGPNAHVGTVIPHASLLPFVRKTYLAHTDGTWRPDVYVLPWQTVTLAPGAYHRVVVGWKGTLRLSAGTYFVERLNVANDVDVRLDVSGGGAEMYVTQAALFQGTVIGDATRFVLGFLGTGNLVLGRGFRGTALAPSGTLTLATSGPGSVFEGTFYGKNVVVGPFVTVRKLALPSFGGDLEGCVARIEPRADLPPREREVTYQADIVRSCSMPGASDCRARLVGRANVDYTTAAGQMVANVLSPAQYVALSRDRTRKLRKTEDDAGFAAHLCSDSDSDGDWIVDANDRCPGTPDLTATDDDGCPIAVPPGPSAEDVARVFSRLNLAFNPKCGGASVPEQVSAGAFYWPDFPNRGTYILSGAVRNQPPGCPVWYEFDVEEVNGANAGYRYRVAFMDREANLDLVNLGRPVPDGLIQFNPRPGDVGERDRLARTGGRARIRYRVRAMNGNGVHGPWSEFKLSDRGSCIALGFDCAE